MTKKKCLCCYRELEIAQNDFHPLCCKKIFGKPEPPLLPYSEKQIHELAEKIVRSRVTVTGVQPKISLDVEPVEKSKKARRFTIVGLWGSYILKPPFKKYPHLPETEDLTMHLAELSGIKTVPHTLIRMQNGCLAYITKRIDRINSSKIHMEDMCQLTERLTEQKYDGSYEQVAKAILKFSVNPVLDVVNFYEQVLFSFLTGNADMHLKNFSLLNQPDIGYSLAPAYDLVATALVNRADREEFALTLNGRKRNIKKNDFLEAFARSKIDEKVVATLFRKFEGAISGWNKFIDISFLPGDMKKEFKKLIADRAIRISMDF